jgi:hypothetical protein
MTTDLELCCGSKLIRVIGLGILRTREPERADALEFRKGIWDATAGCVSTSR